MSAGREFSRLTSFDAAGAVQVHMKNGRTPMQSYSYVERRIRKMVEKSWLSDAYELGLVNEAYAQLNNAAWQAATEEAKTEEVTLPSVEGMDDLRQAAQSAIKNARENRGTVGAAIRQAWMYGDRDEVEVLISRAESARRRHEYTNYDALLESGIDRDTARMIMG